MDTKVFDITADELTWLLARKEVEERVGTEATRGLPGTLVLWDICGFSDIEDEAVKKKLLVSFSNSLKHMARASDIVGRVEENVFVLYYSKSQSEDFLRQKCIELNDSFFSELDADERSTVSDITGICAGAVRVPDAGRSYAALYEKARAVIEELSAKRSYGLKFYTSKSMAAFSVNDEDIAPVLSGLEKDFEEGERTVGAYEVTPEDFPKFYRFCQRLCPDVQVCAGIVLYTLKEKKRAEDEPPVDMETAQRVFYDDLVSSLRRKDVVCHYSDDQFLVIYTAEDDRALHLAIERILDKWKNTDYNEKVRVKTEMLILTGD